MLVVWSSWIAALQGLLVARTPFGAWVPDAGLLLVLACAASFDRREAPRVALLVALGRIAFTIEPAPAVLAGFLLAGLVVRAVATVAEVEGALVRTILAGLAGWLFAAWLELVHHVRDGKAEQIVDLLPQAARLWPIGFSSAVFALCFAGWLARLPGLSPLRRERW
jgi:hypothetical protein